MILNLSLDLPEDGTVLRVARRVCRTLLEDLDVVESDISVIEFVTGELCSNVIRHAQSSSGRFTVRLEFYADKVIILVEDTGIGFAFKDVPPVGSERPDLNGKTRLGGFGLELVRELSDHLELYRHDDAGTTVRAEKLLHYRSEAAQTEAEQLDKPDGARAAASAE